MVKAVDNFSELTEKLSTLVELLRWRAARQPQQRAYLYLENGDTEKAQLTYAELDRWARCIAARLQVLGAEGERVLLLYPTGTEYIAAFFGCLYAGAVAVPVFPPRPNRTLDRLEAIVADAHATIALTTPAVFSKLKPSLMATTQLGAMHWLTTDALDESLAGEWKEPEIDSAKLAFLQYTSGSTASPKGVMVSHGNLLHNQRVIKTACRHTEQSTFVSWLPIYHDMGLIGTVIQPMYLGSLSVLISPTNFLQNPFCWLQAISRYKAHTSGGPNFAFDLCVRKITPEQRQTLDLSSWQVAFNGAEFVSSDTMERFAATFASCGFRREALYPCYGLAEATLFVSGNPKVASLIVQPVDREALERNRVLEPNGKNSAWPVVSCGKSWLDHKIVIVDPETLMRVEADQVGEVWVAGPSVAHGYWDKPQETQDSFGAHLANTGDGPYLRTGDLGFIKAGNLFVTGRRKDLIIIRGLNHYPQDIERTVEQSSREFKLGYSAAFSIDEAGAERLVVVQEIGRHHRELDVEKLAEIVRQAVLDQHELQLDTLVLVKPGSIPKTSSGKIQRYLCRTQFLSGSLNVVGSSTLPTAIEKQAEPVSEEDSFIRAALLTVNSEDERRVLLQLYLRQQIAQVLKISPARLDVQQPLTSFGLDSLAAMELKSSLESELGFRLSIDSFFQGQSISQLAGQALAELTSATSKPASVVAQFDDSEHALSQGQRAMWFLCQLSPESAAYNISFVVRIRSELDEPALLRTFQALVDRHEILRTTYKVHESDLVQEVQPQLEIKLNAIDASTWSEAEIKECAAELSASPFDLEQGPVLRLHLFRRSASDAVLLLTIHHIAIDFWSLGVLLDELRILYPAQRIGARASLPPAPPQYAAYIRWQTEMLAGWRGQQLRAYWQKQLSGKLPVLKLPTDRPRPPVQTYRGSSHQFTLNEELTRGLRELANAEGTTLYVTLLAVFYVLLHRYSDQEDILLGSFMAARSRAEFEGIVGFIANTVPLRADLSGDPNFHTFLQRVRRAVEAGLEHQDYPFPLLIDELQVLREPDRSPLFDVVFQLQKLHRLEDLSQVFALHESGTQKELGGLTVEPFPFEQRFARFDMEVQLVEADQALYGTVLYNTDLFDPTTIVQMVEHLQTILEAAVNGPYEHVSALSARIPAQTLGVEVISVFTAEPLAESLSFWMEKLRIPARLRFAPYNQVFQKLMDPTANHAAVRIVLLRLEDWANSEQASEEDFLEKLERNVRDFLDVLETSSSRQRSRYLVCLCPESNALATNATRLASLRKAESLLRQTIQSLSDVHLIDYHDVIERYDVGEINDPTADELGHVPYTPDFFTALGTAIVRRILSLQLPHDPGAMATVLEQIWSTAPVKNEPEQKVVVDVARELKRGRIALPSFVRQNSSPR
jgi:acyl-CoA synthetase (AMP-forming)/AMP-acid ligase II/acyl carrier protein